MRLFIIIITFLVFGYAYNSNLSKSLKSGNEQTCLTNELHGDMTEKEYKHIVMRRKKVRDYMNKKLHRNEQEILYVPIVFHNLYKIVDGEAIHSYCDYIKGRTKPLEDDDGEFSKLISPMMEIILRVMIKIFVINA